MIVLTPDFFEYYDRLYPNTFLYYEETILALMMNKVGLCFELAEDTNILHKEGMSTFGKIGKQGKTLTEKYYLRSYAQAYLVKWLPYLLVKRCCRCF